MMKKKAGMTLIELLVAALIVTVAFAGVMESVMAMLYLIEVTKTQTVALGDLKNMMERIRSTVFDSMVSRFPKDDVDGPTSNPYDTIVGGYTLQSEQITVTYPSITSDPLEIRVTVSWQDKRGRTYSVAASTQKTR